MIAITGITGHTGSFFLQELVKNNYPEKIRCLVHNVSKADMLKTSGLDIEIIEGSLQNEEDIQRLLDGVEIVVHIAGIHYSPDIVRIGRKNGIKKYILVHTTGIYSKYKTASAEYLRIEQEIFPFLQRDNITIIRPTMIFGDLCDYNISKFIRLISKAPIVPVIDHGKSLIQPVNARDLAKAYYATLVSDRVGGKAYDLSGERPLSIYELYQSISAMLGKKILIINIPMKLGVCGAKLIRILSFGKVDLVEKVLRMGEDRSYSHKEASDDFGYQPEAFEIGLKREVQAYLETRG